MIWNQIFLGPYLHIYIFETVYTIFVALNLQYDLSIFGAVFVIGDALKMFGSAMSTIAGVIFFLRDFDLLRLLRLLWLGRLMKKYTCGGASLEWLVAEFMKAKFSAPPHFYISQSLPPKFYIFRLLCSCKTSRFLHLHRVCCCESPCING